MNRTTLSSLAQSFLEISEAFHLSPEHDVVHDANSVDFAKHYVKGHRGEHTINPTPKHEKDSEYFHSTYDSHTVRHGFAGSGTTVYTHKKTGDKYEVDRTPRYGKGFYGTTHSIRKI